MNPMMIDDYENYLNVFEQSTEYSLYHPEYDHERHSSYRGNPRDEIQAQDKAQGKR